MLMLLATSGSSPLAHDVLTLTILSNDRAYFLWVIREFKKTTTAKATGRSLNERFNQQNNGSAHTLLRTFAPKSSHAQILSKL